LRAWSKEIYRSIQRRVNPVDKRIRVSALAGADPKQGAGHKDCTALFSHIYDELYHIINGLTTN